MIIMCSMAAMIMGLLYNTAVDSTVTILLLLTVHHPTHFSYCIVAGHFKNDHDDADKMAYGRPES